MYRRRSCAIDDVIHSAAEEVADVRMCNVRWTERSALIGYWEPWRVGSSLLSNCHERFHYAECLFANGLLLAFHINYSTDATRVSALHEQMALVAIRR